MIDDSNKFILNKIFLHMKSKIRKGLLYTNDKNKLYFNKLLAKCCIKTIEDYSTNMPP